MTYVYIAFSTKVSTNQFVSLISTDKSEPVNMLQDGFPVCVLGVLGFHTTSKVCYHKNKLMKNSDSRQAQRCFEYRKLIVV